MQWNELRWLNPPPASQVQHDSLQVRTATGSDFWRVTHYGFTRDEGHFLHTEVAGSFAAQVRFDGDWQGQYDHAGLMLRLDERRWIKAGIEYEGGQRHLSVVVTLENSDWSVAPLPETTGEVWFRIVRHGSAALVQYSLNGERYHMLRLAHFPEADRTQVGIMCCSPDSAGCTVNFREFTVQPVTALDPHAS